MTWDFFSLAVLLLVLPAESFELFPKPGPSHEFDTLLLAHIRQQLLSSGPNSKEKEGN